jgi:iron complex outermembrane receptor protein
MSIAKPKIILSVALLLLLTALTTNAQTKISGTITDSQSKEPLIGVSIQVKNKIIGTITNARGQFELNTSTPLPFSLVLSFVGYETQEVQITSNNSELNVALAETAILGQEIVVAASRIEESVMKSPVTIEKMDLRAMQQNPSSSFYEGLGNLKGIDLATQGLLFKSINMRGFGGTGNPRTVQLIDGMDNSAPGLNFPMDNMIGIPELDLESVEILPGAASALYGPNAINGLVLMNSKSPFLYQGLSANIKTGVMTASNRSKVTTPMYDVSVRYAKAFNNRIAFKSNFSYLGAQDWQANNMTNLNAASGNRHEQDLINVYGDEVAANLQAVAEGVIANPLVSNELKAQLQGAMNAGMVPNMNVNRTGYEERHLVDYGTKSLKANAALHYRISDKIEAIGQFNYGYGTTVYTGTGRYSLRDFNLSQTKLELRGDNFMLRSYTTQENSGNSHFAGLTAVNMLNAVTPHELWFASYLQKYLTNKMGGMSEDASHDKARSELDALLPKPGTTEFNNLLDTYSSRDIVNGGGGFRERTSMYHTEGLYNFKNEIKFVDLLVGANFRQYRLKSFGTLFADNKPDENGKMRNGVIPINEYGAFMQAGKSLFGDHLKLTASLRYDKNENFEGQFSPRVSAVTTFGNSNIRLSYQTGFRIPTTQNQYIDLRTPSGILIGGLPEFNSRYNLGSGISLTTINAFQADVKQNGAASKYITNDVKQQAYQYVKGKATTEITQGVNAAVEAGQIPADLAPAVIESKVNEYMNSPQGMEQVNKVAPAYALAALPKYQYKKLEPERVISYEIGYKGLIGKKLMVDANYYFTKYENFIGSTAILVPTKEAAPGLPIESGIGSSSTRIAYQRPANTSQDITIYGWALQADYALPNNFIVGANVASNVLKNFRQTDEVLWSGFNSPKYRYNISFGRRLGTGRIFGFNATLRHQTEFTWESSFPVPSNSTLPFFTNTNVPAITNVDAQASFKFSAIKSILKIGGTNIGGKPYIQAFGSPSIGSMYYVSLTFDELLNK